MGVEHVNVYRSRTISERESFIYNVLDGLIVRRERGWRKEEGVGAVARRPFKWYLGSELRGWDRGWTLKHTHTESKNIFLKFYCSCS